MIQKGIDYAAVKDVTTVEFGNGTLRIVNGIQEDNSHASILMKTSPKKPVGDTIPSGNINSDEFEPQVVLVFNNIEGLEVLQEFINNVRRDLTAT